MEVGEIFLTEANVLEGIRLRAATCTGYEDPTTQTSTATTSATSTASTSATSSASSTARRCPLDLLEHFDITVSGKVIGGPLTYGLSATWSEAEIAAAKNVRSRPANCECLSVY